MKIRVLLVEASPVIRDYLRGIVARDRRLEVVAAVPSAADALQLIDRVRPDVISLDMSPPDGLDMDGFAATRAIMSQRPTPIVILSGCPRNRTDFTMKALEAGALTVLEKPSGSSREEYESLAEGLCLQLAIMSQVKVVRQRIRQEARNPAGRPVWGQGKDSSAAPALLGIASSTGGPAALMSLLPQLGPGFPLPVLLVQHMTPSFLESFAAWLQEGSGMPVAVLSKAEVPSPGKIYVAAAGLHLCFRRGQADTSSAGPVCAQRPSATVLFQSMAESLGPASLGVVLTGMGEDGAAGLLDIRAVGGYTIAEDRSTAIVYGMPAAAVRVGAVCESLPLPKIAGRVLELVSAGSSPAAAGAGPS